MNLPIECVVDSNVPIVANYAEFSSAKPENISNECVASCKNAIEHIIKTMGLVIDDGGEILSEYRRNLSLNGQPGISYKFLIWIYDHEYSFPLENRVLITRYGDSYLEFPETEELNDFDSDDRKFIAVSNAHPRKPPILQAVDPEWWGFKTHLEKHGINIVFLCPDFCEKRVESHFAKKPKVK
ncbi:MAG: hypothetical protein NUW37_10020 [Planctomycetes bacterium]|nr:hypothetical protein [Planctomycetota bacterium]